MRHVRAMSSESQCLTTSEHGTASSARVRAQKSYDTFASAPCPLCGVQLVARMLRNGPGFPCKCKP